MISRTTVFLTVFLFSNCNRIRVENHFAVVNNLLRLIHVNEIPPGTPKSKVHLYILMGQSNMVGWDKTDQAHWNDVSSVSGHVQMYVEDEEHSWVKAKHPIHYNQECGVGPGLEFGNRMLLDDDPDAYIGLIPCAVGGTSIQEWINNTNSIYTDAKDRIKAAQVTGVVKGMIWLQGEADCYGKTPFITPGYFARLKVIFNRVRTLVKRDKPGNELPIVLGELGEFYRDGDPDGHKNFNRNLADILDPNSDKYIPKTRIASSKDLVDKGDHLHFNSEAATIMGKRMGDQMVLLHP